MPSDERPVYQTSHVTALDRSQLDAELPASICSSRSLPSALLGHSTPAVERQVRSFLSSVAAMFEAWLRRRENRNTRRAYRADVMDFVAFMAIQWPNDAD